ncbi:MAG: heat-inducible transcriptional repressor HrcA [Gemmatimonadota bacterium]|nr:heat-inducible transcriptional repressor HrcA [Gemmatimonadota bacterium]
MALKRRTGDVPLSRRERSVLEAVVRTYVETAEPAGSRTLSRRYDFGVSAATIRNTMADLEDDGYLTHPHTSAGRVPTDMAYRFFVDRVVKPESLTPAEAKLIEREVSEGDSTLERILRSATRALGILVNELGVGSVPQLDNAQLEKIDLIRVSSSKVLMVVTVRSGMVRTVYVDLPGDVPRDVLTGLQRVLNERLAGLTFVEIRRSFGERLRDAVEDPAARDILNIFVESSDEFFGTGPGAQDQVVLGQTSAIAAQPEFATSARLKDLITLTEQKELLAKVLGKRVSGGGPYVTIGGEHAPELAGFTLVTSGYRLGGLRGVVGVIGPTRMPYEKVIAIVDYTSSLVTRMLEP